MVTIGMLLIIITFFIKYFIINLSIRLNDDLECEITEFEIKSD